MYGGYPEYVLLKDPAYFSDLINDVLYKDIIRMYDLKNPDVLKDLLLLLADRTGQQSTFTKLSHVLNVKNDTVKEYIYYLKNTFLVDELPDMPHPVRNVFMLPKNFTQLTTAFSIIYLEMFHVARRLNKQCIGY